jgi:hypothetical protein
MLMNYVALEKDVPTRMHFTDHYLVGREIWDDKLGRFKPIKSLVFWVDELNGQPTARTFSVVSEALASMLRPSLPDHSYIEKIYVITKRGEGFATRYELQIEPKT